MLHKYYKWGGYQLKQRHNHISANFMKGLALLGLLIYWLYIGFGLFYFHIQKPHTAIVIYAMIPAIICTLVFLIVRSKWFKNHEQSDIGGFDYSNLTGWERIWVIIAFIPTFLSLSGFLGFLGNLMVMIILFNRIIRRHTNLAVSYEYLTIMIWLNLIMVVLEV